MNPDARGLVLEVLRHKLAFEALGDGTPAATDAHLARLTGLTVDEVHDVLVALIADGTFETDDFRHVQIMHGPLGTMVAAWRQDQDAQ